MRNFQNGELRGIITTDIMARGLDISDVSHVINFDISDVPEQYIHRIGRTGRADKSGVALSFISVRELELFSEVELLMNMEVENIEIPSEVQISDVLIEAEKTKQKVKILLKKVKISENKAFHEKSEKNKQVNLGGPGKTKPRKTKPTNRGMLKKRAQKNK